MSNPLMNEAFESCVSLDGPGSMKVVQVSGLAYDMGRQLGRELRDDISEHLSLAGSADAVRQPAWRDRKAALLETLQHLAPQSLAELRGMADASGVVFDELLWLNTEPEYGLPELADRCTNVVFGSGPDGPVWGKNNDRPMGEKPRPTCAKVVERSGQIPVVVFTYAGMLSTCDGMNAAGLCVGHSSVGSVFEQSDHHVPLRIWAYEGLFTCSSTRQYMRHMAATPLRGKGYAMVCVDASGDAVSLEAPCPTLQVRRPHHAGGHVHCVNLYQLPALAHADRRSEQGRCNAKERQQWLDQTLAHPQPMGLSDMLEILRHDQQPAICRPGDTADTSLTEYSMIGLPTRRQVMFLQGNPAGGQYQTLTFKSASPGATLSREGSQQVVPRIEREPLTQSLRLACGWIQDVAQLASDTFPADTFNDMKFEYAHWKGAVRGEYSAATQRWSFFCPIWHTGQAVKALTLASQTLHEPAFLRGARDGAQFIFNQQIWNPADADHGLLLAYEDVPDEVNTSAVLEAMDGLLVLADHLNDDTMRQRVVAAGDFLVDRMYMKGMGLFRDLYNPRLRALGSPLRFRSKNIIGGRPLLDDAMLLKLYRITGKSIYLDTHLEIAQRLVADQNPAGNWLDYGPCDVRTGRFHPRHTYWWGLPLIDTYLHTGQREYLDTALAAGEFCVQALRSDGGYFRGTELGFKTDSFGHATSGSACAALLFMRLFEVTGHQAWFRHAELALRFCMSVQLRDTADANLRGAILEKVHAPDGTDRLPYHLRDLGTIFFVTAGVTYLNLVGKLQTSQAAAAV